MSRTLRIMTANDVLRIKAAIRRLSEARHLLAAAGVTQATDKVRSAIKSTEGALRHAMRCANEQRSD